MVRWKFTQSHKQLSALSPDRNCLSKIMCSIANLFDTNIKKFDPKKHQFFSLNAYGISHLKNLIFFRSKISVIKAKLCIRISKALNLRKPKLSASYKEDAATIFQ